MYGVKQMDKKNAGAPPESVGAAKGSLSLVDYLAYQTGCAYVSDLRGRGSLGRYRLLRAVEKLRAEDFSLWDWNDALEYLADEGPEETAKDARRKLLFRLEQEISSD